MKSSPVSLVTGAAGFIGSHLSDELLARGHRVVALDDLSGGQRENIPAGARFCEGSILDETLVKSLFGEHQFDYVFHFAAYAAEGLSHFIRRFNYTNNVLGSVNLINASVNHRVKMFIFASSIAVYGEQQVPASEDAAPQPEDPYGVAKYAVELDLRAAQAMFGLNWVAFRAHNVYGERQNLADRYRNVVGIFMNCILHGRPLPIFGDGEQTRAFTYVGDIVPVIANSISQPAAWNQVFNIGADTPRTVNELGRAVSRAMRVPFNPEYLPARQEPRNCYASHQKGEQCFGRRERTTLEEGLARMAAWAKSAGQQKAREFSALEIERNLPPSWRE